MSLCEMSEVTGGTGEKGNEPGDTGGNKQVRMIFQVNRSWWSTGKTKESEGRRDILGKLKKRKEKEVLI